MPSVSVILVTYSKPDELKRAIESVLTQSYKDYELIIVDDCSTDNTDVVVGSFIDERIKYIKLESNSGGSFAPRIIGQKFSSGKYISVLDDDDFWVDKDKLSLQVDYLKNHPKCVLVGTNAIGLNGGNKVAIHINYPQDDSVIRSKLLAMNLFYHSSVMYTRDAYLKIGGYKILNWGRYVSYANEYDLWLQMGTVGEMANLPICGVGYNSIPKWIGLKTRIEYARQHINDIRKYKSYYPNYCKAVAIILAIVVLEVPILVRLKRFVFRKVKR